MMRKIKLGQQVRDTLSGAEGVAIGRTEWLHGCPQVRVQPSGCNEGTPLDSFTVAEPQLEVVTEKGSVGLHP